MPPNGPYMGTPVHDPQGVLGRTSTSMGEGPMSAILMELARRAMAQRQQPTISAGTPYWPPNKFGPGEQVEADRNILRQRLTAEGYNMGSPVDLYQLGGRRDFTEEQQAGFKKQAAVKMLVDMGLVAAGSAALGAAAPILPFSSPKTSILDYLIGPRVGSAYKGFVGPQWLRPAPFQTSTGVGPIGTAAGAAMTAMPRAIEFNPPIPGPSGIID